MAASPGLVKINNRPLGANFVLRGPKGNSGCATFKWAIMETRFSTKISFFRQALIAYSQPCTLVAVHLSSFFLINQTCVSVWVCEMWGGGEGGKGKCMVSPSLLFLRAWMITNKINNRVNCTLNCLALISKDPERSLTSSFVLNWSVVYCISTCLLRGWPCCLWCRFRLCTRLTWLSCSFSI